MDFIDKIFDYLHRIVQDDLKRRIKAEVDAKVASGQKALDDDEDNLRKMMRGELSKKELEALYQRLKKAGR